MSQKSFQRVLRIWPQPFHEGQGPRVLLQMPEHGVENVAASVGVMILQRALRVLEMEHAALAHAGRQIARAGDGSAAAREVAGHVRIPAHGQGIVHAVKQLAGTVCVHQAHTVESALQIKARQHEINPFRATGLAARHKLIGIMGLRRPAVQFADIRSGGVEPDAALLRVAAEDVGNGASVFVARAVRFAHFAEYAVMKSLVFAHEAQGRAVVDGLQFAQHG